MFLKKVILALREDSGKEHFLPLIKRLQECEIEVEDREKDEITDGITSHEGYVCERNASERSVCERNVCERNVCERDMCERGMEGTLFQMTGNGVLYITDSTSWAAFLQEKNLPVLGWLHEGGEPLNGLNYLMECPEEIDVRYLERVYRRFHDIPWEILETERCLLRETTVSDVDDFFEIYSNPEIVRYTEDLYPEKEQEQAYIREYIEKVYHYFEFGVWTVILKETGEIIGRAGFSVREGYDLPELGFVIGVPWQGKRIATEICRAILQYGEEEFGFDRVQALVQPGNAVSLALCHKLGFAKLQTVYERQQEYLLLMRE